MPVCPLVGFSQAGEPLINERISGQEAAPQPAVEIVRRLGIASPLMLCMPHAVLDKKPSEAQKNEILYCNDCIVGPFTFAQTDGMRSWLEGGAKYAFVCAPATDSPAGLADTIKEAALSGALPAERLVLLLNAPSLVSSESVRRVAADVHAVAASAGAGCYECCRSESVGLVSGVVLVVPPGTPAQREEELLQLIAPLATRDRVQVFLAGLSTTGVAMIGHLHHMNIHALSTACLGPAAHGAPPPPPPPPLCADAACLTALFANDAPLELGPCIVACVRTDRSDGLFPTLVLEADGAALGLVYSSADSIAAALRCGRGVYWSRSRQSLWRKGDTSGAWQTLLRVRLDCDSDALAFTVAQHGEPPAFCHKGSLSCWGPPGGLRALQQTLKARKANAPPGSYTKRLFDDANLLRNKLVEEAQELAECAPPPLTTHALHVPRAEARRSPTALYCNSAPLSSPACAAGVCVCSGRWSLTTWLPSAPT